MASTGRGSRSAITHISQGICHRLSRVRVPATTLCNPARRTSSAELRMILIINIIEMHSGRRRSASAIVPRTGLLNGSSRLTSLTGRVAAKPGEKFALRQFLDTYLLVILAVLTWLLLIVRPRWITDLPPRSVISALYVGAYLTGGTLAPSRDHRPLPRRCQRRPDGPRGGWSGGYRRLGRGRRPAGPLCFVQRARALRDGPHPQRRARLMAAAPEHAAVLRDGHEQLVESRMCWSESR